MGTGKSPHVGEVDPSEAWRILEDNKSARLIDVRTSAEWSFVGIPDLGKVGQRPIFIEWTSLPNMSENPRFAAQLDEALGNDVPDTLLFLCRSGARSLRAAYLVADHLAARGETATCLNIAEGFEGDLDASAHRGSMNGWKARGLSWRQS
jgi:rhodanese-related sulfurtransferase